jgi:hypothetical protein
VSTPDQRARDRDRDAAIDLVEAAWAQGRIVEADRDKRVQELRRAQTLADIEMFVHDLRPAVPAPRATPGPAPAVPYGPPVPAWSVPSSEELTRQNRPGRAALVVPLVVVLVVAVAVVGGIVATVGAIDEQVSSPSAQPQEARNVLTPGGYRDLVAAVRERTGSTTVFMAVLYPTYAVVEVPVDARTRREEYWYWNGRELTRNDNRSTASFGRYDLSAIDADQLVRLVRRVRPLVDDPTSWYAIVRAPDSDGAVMWAYASNEYSETAYLGAKPDGTVVHRSTPG